MMFCHVPCHIRLLPEHALFHGIWRACYRCGEPSPLAEFILGEPPAKLDEEVHNHEDDDYSSQYAQNVCSHYGFAVCCFI